MRFDELEYAVKSICDHHGLVLVEENFDWFWRFENDSRIVDVHYNKKIQNGLFEKAVDSQLKIFSRNKKPHKAKPKWYRNLGLLELEVLVVQLSAEIQPKSKQYAPEYGFCDCGGEFVRRTGKFGDFLGCSDYPKCREIKKLVLNGK